MQELAELVDEEQLRPCLPAVAFAKMETARASLQQSADMLALALAIEQGQAQKRMLTQSATEAINSVKAQLKVMRVSMKIAKKLAR